MNIFLENNFSDDNGYIFYRFSHDIPPSKAKDQDRFRHIKPQDDAQGPLCQSPRPGLRVLDRGQEEAETLPSQTQGQRREGEINCSRIIFKISLSLSFGWVFSTYLVTQVG